MLQLSPADFLEANEVGEQEEKPREEILPIYGVMKKQYQDLSSGRLLCLEPGRVKNCAKDKVGDAG